jgi:hypothetical protein
VFDAHRHCFNLDFHPPAFVGDLAAPVVVLYANGGFDPNLTPREFADGRPAAPKGPRSRPGPPLTLGLP